MGQMPCFQGSQVWSVADFRLEPGFILEEGHYTPIVFSTATNTPFDYNKYNDFRFH